MNVRLWFWLGYSLLFLLAGYGVFHLTSYSQFALLLLGYAGLAAGCLGWWTIHAHGDDPGTDDAIAKPAGSRTEGTVSPAKYRAVGTMEHV